MRLADAPSRDIRNFRNLAWLNNLLGTARDPLFCGMAWCVHLLTAVAAAAHAKTAQYFPRPWSLHAAMSGIRSTGKQCSSSHSSGKCKPESSQIAADSVGYCSSLTLPALRCPSSCMEEAPHEPPPPKSMQSRFPRPVSWLWGFRALWHNNPEAFTRQTSSGTKNLLKSRWLERSYPYLSPE